MKNIKKKDKYYSNWALLPLGKSLFVRQTQNKKKTYTETVVIFYMEVFYTSCRVTTWTKV